MPKQLDNCCIGKIKFYSKQAANDHFTHLNESNKKRLTAYKCGICDGFHSGHEDKKKQGLSKGLRIKKNEMIKKITLIACVCLLASCADTQPQIKEYLTGYQYGFWSGIWHGLICPISFIAKVFGKDIDIYAINNTGNWYCFGFILGVSSTFGASVTYKK